MKIKGFQNTIKWYDKHAQEYANAHTNPQQDVLKKFIAMLPVNSKILDAGCGPGRDAEFFHLNGVDGVGLDISKGMLQLARERNPSLSFIEGDFLICLSMMQHLMVSGHTLRWYILKPLQMLNNLLRNSIGS